MSLISNNLVSILASLRGILEAVLYLYLWKLYLNCTCVTECLLSKPITLSFFSINDVPAKSHRLSNKIPSTKHRNLPLSYWSGQGKRLP